MARTMLCDKNLPKNLWLEAVNTACYILNRVSIRPILKRTPYELYKGRKPDISYFHIFGSKCFILNNKDALGKFNSKCDEGIFLGYSVLSKAYTVFNKKTLPVEESIQVKVDDTNSIVHKSQEEDENELSKNLENLSLNHQNNQPSNSKSQNEEIISQEEKEPSFPRERKYIENNNIIGDASKGIRTRASIRNECQYVAFISQVEPKNIMDVLNDEN